MSERVLARNGPKKCLNNFRRTTPFAAPAKCQNLTLFRERTVQIVSSVESAQDACVHR